MIGARALACADSRGGLQVESGSIELVIGSGDTLGDIVCKYVGDYTEENINRVRELNRGHIADVEILSPGMVLTLPRMITKVRSHARVRCTLAARERTQGAARTDAAARRCTIHHRARASRRPRRRPRPRQSGSSMSVSCRLRPNARSARSGRRCASSSARVVMQKRPCGARRVEMLASLRRPQTRKRPCPQSKRRPAARRARRGTCQ